MKFSSQSPNEAPNGSSEGQGPPRQVARTGHFQSPHR